MNTRILLLGLALASGGVAQGQNLVINGDLEDTTANGCDFNNTNASFTAKMANAAAFGEAEELDIIQTPGCAGSFGFQAQSGQYKVGMHQQVLADLIMDAFSLELSSPMIAGQDYTLTFYASLFPSGIAGPVEVGLSSSATDFGTLVASGTPVSASAWTEFTSSFVAPVNATHLTVRQSTVDDSFSFVDNFQLEEAAGPAVPTLSTWGLITFAVFMAGAGIFMLRRRMSTRLAG